ncbi:polycystin cation channel protein, partial [Cystoisospora suis]
LFLLFLTAVFPSFLFRIFSFPFFACSLTSSAAFLLGGTVGNIDVYSIVKNHRVFAGLFFPPLFIVFTFVCFNVVVALFLKTYDYCADEVDRSLKRHPKREDEFRRTRLERWTRAIAVFYREFMTELFSTKARQKVVDIASESSKSSDKEEQEDEDEDDKLPQYPAWMWESIGMQNPYTAEGWIDPHAFG